MRQAKKPETKGGKTPVCRPAAPFQAPTRRVIQLPTEPRRGALHPRHHVIQAFPPPASHRQEHPPRRTPGASPQACPAHSAAQNRPQRRCARDTPPATPAWGRSGCPKTEIRPKLQLSCDCGLSRSVKTRIEARKSGKSDAQRPISALQKTEGGPQSQKSCTKVEIFVFARRIVATKHISRKMRAPSMPIRPSSSTEP